MVCISDVFILSAIWHHVQISHGLMMNTSFVKLLRIARLLGMDSERDEWVYSSQDELISLISNKGKLAVRDIMLVLKAVSIHR